MTRNILFKKERQSVKGFVRVLPKWIRVLQKYERTAAGVNYT